jgi:ABC-type transport system involved in multi-copper enzyme maturation permease subunit
MSLRNVGFRHLRLISLYAVQHAVRGGSGLVFLLVTLLFGLVAAQIILSPVEMMMVQAAKDGHEMDREEALASIVEFGRPVVRWAIGGELQTEEPKAPLNAGTVPGRPAVATESPIERWTTFLVADRPALLSAILLILIFGMPLAVPLVAFNQVSGDVQSRGLRYLLVRTERANIFFGRFLGTAIFTIAVTAFLVATITLYLGLRIQIYPGGVLAAWGLRGVLVLAVLVLPYIALCSWVSASIDSPFLSLLTTSLVIGAVPLFAWIASMKWEPAGVLKYLLPSGLQDHLLHPDLTHSLGTVLACLGYTAVFLFLGYRRFETRDL